MEEQTLTQEIRDSYAALAQAKTQLLRAEAELAGYELDLRTAHAEALIEAKNERTAGLYMDGLKDHDEYRRLRADRMEAEVAHAEARYQVEALQLVVKALSYTSGPQRSAVPTDYDPEDLIL